ncbi:MAG: hypothetical protein ACTSW1_01150 [Candidatus Hodarchaeales archaeon]
MTKIRTIREQNQRRYGYQIDLPIAITDGSMPMCLVSSTGQITVVLTGN